MGIEHTRPAAVEAGQSLSAVKMGNPPVKYTIGVHNQICENIKKGNRPVTAAQMAGIPSHMFYRWMNQGKAGDPHLYQFAEDVELAIGFFESTVVAAVVDDIPNDIKSAHFLLERRFPEGYAKDVDAKVQAIMSDFVARLQEALTEPEIAKILSIYNGARNGSAQGAFQLMAKPDDAEESTE